MENLFGTDGIRSKVGEAILNQNDLINIGKSISIWAKQKNSIPRILIASDNRISGPLIKNLIISGLIQYKSEITDSGVLPTPAIYNLVEKQKLFDVGIMVSASHNPYYDNGIKIIDKHHGKLTKEDELQISQIFQQKKFDPIDYDNLGKLWYSINRLKDIYRASVISYFQPSFLKDFKIVLDCANGAFSDIAPEVFENFGAKVISIHNFPDGKNINKNCGSTSPFSLQLAVKEQNADIGFAFDGDGDRILAVNKHGILKDGDDIISFLLNNQKYKTEAKIVTTIMSNYGFEIHLKEKKIDLIRTKVGDKFVVQELKKNNLLIGGEPSGHIILRDYLNSSDGLFVALRIAESIEQTKNLDITSFIKFPQITINLKIVSKENLDNEPFFSIIKKYQNELERGRLIVRYSGTEPLLRLTVESPNINQVKNILLKLEEELNLAFMNFKGTDENKKITQDIR